MAYRFHANHIGKGKQVSRLTLQRLCPVLAQSHGLDNPVTMGKLMQGLIARAASSRHDWMRGQADHRIVVLDEVHTICSLGGILALFPNLLGDLDINLICEKLAFSYSLCSCMQAMSTTWLLPLSRRSPTCYSKNRSRRGCSRSGRRRNSYRPVSMTACLSLLSNTLFSCIVGAQL